MRQIILCKVSFKSYNCSDDAEGYYPMNRITNSSNIIFVILIIAYLWYLDFQLTCCGTWCFCIGASTSSLNARQCIQPAEAGRQSDRQVAPEVTGESCSLCAGRQSLLLGHCSSSPPLPLPWLRAGGSDDVTRAHTHIHTHTQTQTHTYTRPLPLALCRSVSLSLSLSLSLPLLYAAILGSGVWNNPRVRMSVCVCACVCVSWFHPHATRTHTHTHNTVRRTHFYCLPWLQEWSSGSKEIRSEKDSFHFYAQLFLRRRRFHRSASTVVDFLTNRLLAVSSGRPARCQARPESDLLSPPLVVIFARRRRRAAGAQTEGKRGERERRGGERNLFFPPGHILTHFTLTAGFSAPWRTTVVDFYFFFHGTWSFV